MAFTGAELKGMIGNPVASFTLNAGTGAGAGSFYAGLNNTASAPGIAASGPAPVQP